MDNTTALRHSVNKTLDELWVDQPGLLFDAAFEPGSCRSYVLGYARASLRRAGFSRPTSINEQQELEALIVRLLRDFVQERAS